MICTVIVNERPLSTFECPDSWAICAGRGRPANVAFLDFEVADLWGRLVFEGVAEWYVQSREKAGRPVFHYRESIPGSILPPYQPCPDFLPLAVLEREFFLHVEVLRKLPT